MFQTFNTLEELIGRVIDDREITGEGAATADRFPVRFVLFDNFRDCCDFVDELFHIGNIQIDRLEQWMDPEYPDTMLTHKRLADQIHKLILNHPTQYRVIMPFSELARFYNNEPEKAEFNSLINTIKSFDSLSSGFAYKQRVYIPVVGLEGKMQHFRDDAQSFIWYFNNPDRQLDYHLILVDKTTYGVNGLEERFNLANSVTEWLKFWQFPELKEKIICTSHAVFSHAKYAQPDNAFTYCVCKNSYELLTKGLRLDVDCIPYREEESVYWDTLAKRIDLDHFHFEKFFNEQFGIHDLADYRVFFKQWFEHKDNFMRWLLAKYYTHKFCDEGYVCRVLQYMESFTDTALAQHMARSIFMLDDPTKYIEQRAIGLKIAAENGVELPKEVQEQVVAEIQKVAATQGVLSAIPYLASNSDLEKRLIIEWYTTGKIDKDQLRDLYPDLYYYLNQTIASAEEPWVLEYIDAYKEAKVRNEYTEEIKNFISDKNENELAHHKWSNKFYNTRSKLNARTDISHYFWIDGLGLDWLSFIERIVKEYEPEGYYVNEASVAVATLPSRTDINKVDIEKLSEGLAFDKIGDLDEIAHTKRPYPAYIIEDLQMMRREIEKLLKSHPGEKIAIVSDHGMTYMSQLCEGCNLKGFKSDHWGRVVTYTGKGAPVKDDKYIVLKDNKTVCALKHESLGAKIPVGMGAHGGATPEEELVPIIIISPEKTAATWSASQKSFEINEADPCFVVDIYGLHGGEIPVVEYNGKTYKLTNAGMTYTSERLAINPDAKKVVLRIGQITKEFTVSIKMAVQEDDLFSF